MAYSSTIPFYKNLSHQARKTPAFCALVYRVSPRDRSSIEERPEPDLVARALRSFLYASVVTVTSTASTSTIFHTTNNRLFDSSVSLLDNHTSSVSRDKEGTKEN